MKFCLAAVTALLFSYSTFAVDWTPNDKRNIYDLMYLPEAGRIFGESQLGYSNFTQDLSVPAFDIGELQSQSTSFNQMLGYSFHDRFALSVETDYLIHRKSKFDLEDGVTLTGSTERTAKGLGDPTVSARFRAVDQRDSGFSLDLIPEYTFKSGEDEEDNNKSGLNSYGLGVQVGKKYNDTQLAFTFEFERSDKNETKNSAGEKLEDDASIDYNLSFEYQQRLSDLWLAEVNVTIGISPEETQENKTTAEKQETESRATTSIAGSLIYLVNEDFLLTGGIALGAMSDYEVKETGSSATKYENTSIFVSRVAARYQF